MSLIYIMHPFYFTEHGVVISQHQQYECAGSDPWFIWLRIDPFHSNVNSGSFLSIVPVTWVIMHSPRALEVGSPKWNAAIIHFYKFHLHFSRLDQSKCPLWKASTSAALTAGSI